MASHLLPGMNLNLMPTGRLASIFGRPCSAASRAACQHGAKRQRLWCPRQFSTRPPARVSPGHGTAQQRASSTAKDGTRIHSEDGKRGNSRRFFGLVALWSGALLVTVGVGNVLARQRPLRADAASASKAALSDGHGDNDNDRGAPGLPQYRLAEVKSHGADSERPWVTHKNKVYDITDWVSAHPGGDVILRAAGGSIDAYWDIFTVHKQAYVQDILDNYLIGHVARADLVDGKVPDEQLEDPFADDPRRDEQLIPLTPKPMNAEAPRAALTDFFLTPNNVFYVRNHLWVPRVDADKASSHPLTVELGDGTTKTYSLAELKRRFSTHKITAALQCSGNRRKHMSQGAASTNGLQWDVGGISCAEWEGVRLVDVLKDAGLQDGRADGAKHVCFSGLETYGASIPMDVAVDPRCDVLLAHSMNGQPIPPDHGFPLRVVVPGHVAARSVKWLRTITVSDEESPSQWQRRDYKCFGPNQTKPTTADWEAAPAIQEMPVTSAITDSYVGDDGLATLRGYAYSGGGRQIIRVDVSLDGGKTWGQAELVDKSPKDAAAADGASKGADNHKHWAWKRWRYQASLPSQATGGQGKRQQPCTTAVVKATDDSYNSQPESHAPIYNTRGNLATAWHSVKLCSPSATRALEAAKGHMEKMSESGSVGVRRDTP